MSTLPAKTLLEPALPPLTLSQSEVFAAHAAYVWRVVRYLGVAERDVLDVSQEVFVHAFAKLSDYDPLRGTVRTWLYGFCLRDVANYRRLRRHAVEHSGEDLDAHVAEASDQEAAYAAKQSRTHLLHALDALSEEHRSVTVLHAIEEMSMPEVARLLEIPVQTAYSRYEVARTKLRQALERAARDPARRGPHA